MLILLCVLAAAVAYTLTYILRLTAPVTGLIDIPKDERRMHGISTPLAGGLAVYIAFSACLFLYSLFGIPEVPSGSDGTASSFFTDVAVPFTVCGLVIVLVGLADDRFGLRAYQKLLGQGLCGVAMCLFGVTADSLAFFGNTVALGRVKYPLTVLWVIAVTNIFNLIDGLDGLCTGITIISFGCLGVTALYTGNDAVAACALLFICAAFGFLPHNVTPAKIFPGDTGALFFGFALSFFSCLTVYGTENEVSALLPIVLFGIPVFDCIYAIIRRLISGKSIFVGDCKHLHHVLAKFYGMKTASVLLCLVSLFFCGAALIMTTGFTGEIAGIILFAAGVAFLTRFASKQAK